MNKKTVTPVTTVTVNPDEAYRTQTFFTCDDDAERDFVNRVLNEGLPEIDQYLYNRTPVSVEADGVAPYVELHLQGFAEAGDTLLNYAYKLVHALQGVAMTFKTVAFTRGQVKVKVSEVKNIQELLNHQFLKDYTPTFGHELVILETGGRTLSQVDAKVFYAAVIMRILRTLKWLYENRETVRLDWSRGTISITELDSGIDGLTYGELKDDAKMVLRVFARMLDGDWQKNRSNTDRRFISWYLKDGTPSREKSETVDAVDNTVEEDIDVDDTDTMNEVNEEATNEN